MVLCEFEREHGSEMSYEEMIERISIAEMLSTGEDKTFKFHQ